MSNKMLIDATHPEETRVVVLRGSRVEEFDFEAADRQPLRGNIYLAKVTRVEPSLQAAFVDYGGNRHGFLAFSEIHPDYYQIPFADRQALLQEQAREDAEQAEREDAQAQREGEDEGEEAVAEDRAAESDENEADEENSAAGDDDSDAEAADAGAFGDSSDGGESFAAPSDEPGDAWSASADVEAMPQAAAADMAPSESISGPADASADNVSAKSDDANGGGVESVTEEERVESVGAEDALEELPERRKPRPRQYKIQEVIKRRQVLLVQVVKEERGNKGAALTTYLSLAGRYSVLMPNTARGGGISRKITTPVDRKRLKAIASELEVPEGMGVILRTAGANRTKSEIKRDFEYLLRLWENVRELTLRSTAPKLVYEEGNLIKRSIRDLYSREIDQVVVAGDDGYREAKDFMRMLMPSHARNVQLYKDNVPIFARSGVEAQLDAMFSPQVTLRSGGYIVINQTEALVSIDVNSGRSTREHSIEDTALSTNMEAAEEISRQLRLRDLAGLIVIDFIDMEEKRNNRSVERKLKDCLRADRARIQVGRISHFGLLEMSRQRIRTGVLESSTVLCPHCRGTGQVRSVSSLSLQILRALEDHLLRHSGHHLLVRTREEVALYVLNQKRRHLAQLEDRFGVNISISGDAPEGGAGFAIERGQPAEERPGRTGAIAMTEMPAPPEPIEADEDKDPPEERDATPSEGRDKRRRRRRRRGGGDERDDRRSNGEDPEERLEAVADATDEDEPEDEETDADAETEAASGGASDEEREPRKRRRGRRGGRRRGRGRENGDSASPHTSAGDGSEDAATFASAETDDAEPLGDAHAAEVEALTEAAIGHPADDLDARAAQVDEASAEAPHDAWPHDAEPRDETPSPAAEEGTAEATGEVTSEAAEPARSDTAQPAPVEPPLEDNRPKRSGWWSRKASFF